jgi:hypothetical protein
MRLHALQFALISVLSCTASAVTVIYNSSLLSASRLPVVLTLLRESDGSCGVVSLASTQRHRLLQNYQDVLVERQLFKDISYNHLVSNSEKLQLYGYESHNLWTKAKELCPDLTAQEALGEFFHPNADQHTFLSTQPFTTPDLELHPLVLSGPSGNRVDLTFFSDGCMYLE